MSITLISILFPYDMELERSLGCESCYWMTPPGRTVTLQRINEFNATLMIEILRGC